MYCIKIDKRKRNLFECHIHELVDAGSVYVSKDEYEYVSSKADAAQYEDRYEAECSITAEYEMVVKV